MWGRCHHTSNAVATVSSLGKTYRGLLAPTTKFFSQCGERCHFLITSLEYLLLARYSGTDCGVPSCDMIREEAPSRVSSKAKSLQEGRSGPSGGHVRRCRQAGEGVDTGSLSYCRTHTQTSCSMKRLHVPYVGVSFYPFCLNYPRGHQKGRGQASERVEPAISSPGPECCRCSSHREAAPNRGRQGLCLLILLPWGQQRYLTSG